MNALKKGMALCAACVLVGSFAVMALTPRGMDRKLKNLPGPIDDVIFERVGSSVYKVTITLDDSVEFFAFDLEVNADEQVELPL